MSREHRSVGAGSRLGIGAQVALSAALALAAVLLVNWLTARPGVRHRFDLTAAGRNTLATATRGVLESLDRDVKVEILYRPEDAPLTQVAAELMGRVEKLLALIDEEAGGRIDVEVVDLTNAEAWRARALELRVQGFQNGLVVSSGARRTFVSLLGDLAQVDAGRPAPQGYVPPSVAAFTAEEALVEALLDVTRGETRHAYFTFGFGELDVMDEQDPFGAGFLGAALVREGFKLHRWNPLEDGPLPDDCDVLGVLGPEQAWPEDMRRQVDAYLDGGGRAVVAASSDPELLSRSDVPRLLERVGLGISEGIVATFVPDPATGKALDGLPECDRLFITADQLALHPLLAPFRRAGRGFAILRTHQLRVIEQPPGGLAQVMATTRPNEGWLDAPPIDLRYDERTETAPANIGLGVAASSQLPPPAADVVVPLPLEPDLETRVVAFGATSVFMNGIRDYNEDLWRAVFNWTTDNDHRVMVSPRDPDLRFLPRGDASAMRSAVRLAQWWLPLGALVAGLVIAFLRSRGGPRRAPAREDRA